MLENFEMLLNLVTAEKGFFLLHIRITNFPFLKYFELELLPRVNQIKIKILLLQKIISSESS